MDPFADKVLMIGTLCSLLFLDIVQLWPFVIIVGRDVLITFYRNYLISKNKPLETSKYGKLKTVFQHGMVLIILLINPSQDIINLIVNVNAIYAAATGVQYFVKNGF